MNQRLLNVTRTLAKKPGSTRASIDQAMAVLGVTPPDDYVEFLLESNGAEGFMQSGRYLMVDSVDQLVPCNEPYGLGTSGPGLVAFGSDGGGMLYAFDIRKSPVTIVEVDSACMELGPVTPCGHTLVDFLEYLDTPRS
jgi:hypothetical protein